MPLALGCTPAGSFHLSSWANASGVVVTTVAIEKTSGHAKHRHSMGPQTSAMNHFQLASTPRGCPVPYLENGAWAGVWRRRVHTWLPGEGHPQGL